MQDKIQDKMPNSRELTCIGCPLGCLMTVTMEGESVTSVTGNTCRIGASYARTEVVRPMRTITSTVILDGAHLARLPVKTSVPVPKSSIFAVMAQIRATRVSAPVHAGSIIIKNAANTGADIIASRTVEACTIE